MLRKSKKQRQGVLWSAWSWVHLAVLSEISAILLMVHFWSCLVISAPTHVFAADLGNACTKAVAASSRVG
ncbi:Uncharacterised protein [Mycobacteroides abscessus subsp. abscessus]|nr:Uncharacterised protein [Mycobacteroides abscessus subsp. abscessus]